MKHSNSKSLSNREIALYALYLLGGWENRVHTEDVAIKCFNLAPTKFSWVKYPQYPDRDPARFALEAAKKEKEGSLVNGETERKRTSGILGGWMLTPSGVRWIEANRRRIENSLGKHKQIADRLPSDRKLKELLSSSAYRKYMNFGDLAEISHAELADSLVCTVNTSKEDLRDRLEQIYSISEQLKEEQVKSYVAFCKRRFESLLKV